ncbi:hypothetical protein [Neisseria elongata]|uniref:hypothetical protein n=1 Tax=Neisseria elongata TaxID=495 RepID=UPI0031FE6CC2
MKALQPEGIRIRPSETAVGRIGKPMRRGKRRSKLQNRFKQRQKTKLRHQNTGCSAATLNRQREKRQFACRPTPHRGKHRCYSGLNLNQYGVASPCRTICTVCGFVALS